MPGILRALDPLSKTRKKTRGKREGGREEERNERRGDRSSWRPANSNIPDVLNILLQVARKQSQVAALNEPWVDTLRVSVADYKLRT